MLEREIIQTQGFANVVEDGRVTGFALKVRNPNYRGLTSSLVDGVGVTVDGHVFDHAATLVELQGELFTLEQLRASSGRRWDLHETARVVVPLAGGLEPGVHRVAVDVRLRAPYFPLEHQPTLHHHERELTLLDAGLGLFNYGVSTYSYTGDMETSMTLEDAMAETADMGAKGFEILGEANVVGYPEPSPAWLDTWFANLERYGLTPTNLGSWIDSRMWLSRDLTAEEGAAALRRDITLASKLGFSFVRPKIGVVSLDLQPHPIWEEAVLRSLDLAVEKNVAIIPEIHSPTPIRHKVVDEYIEFIRRTGTEHFGLLIDTGIFMHSASFDGLDSMGMDALTEEELPPPLRPLRVPVSDLADVLPYVKFIQAKFYEVDENLVDLHIDWLPILRVLRDGGYTGWLSSEYEGRRETNRGREQVRRQHAMLRSLEHKL